MKGVFMYCLFCACSVSIAQSAPPPLYDELTGDINYLKKCNMKMDAENLQESKEIRRECLLTAFSCFVNATWLLEPVGNNQEVCRRRLDRIRNVRSSMNHTSVSHQNCPTCAAYYGKSLQTFLTNFKTVLQQMFRERIVIPRTFRI